MGNEKDGFDSGKAELFEQLGHPIRIRILESLYGAPLSFSELKKFTGIESNGHLTFHLGKLGGLVKTNTDGDYALTDEGRCSFRLVGMTDWYRKAPVGDGAPRKRRLSARAAIIILGLLLVGSLAANAWAAKSLGDCSYQVGQMRESLFEIESSRLAVMAHYASNAYEALQGGDNQTAVENLRSLGTAMDRGWAHIRLLGGNYSKLVDSVGAIIYDSYWAGGIIDDMAGGTLTHNQTLGLKTYSDTLMRLNNDMTDITHGGAISDVDYYISAFRELWYSYRYL